MGTTNTVQGFDRAVLQKRREKRWVVYTRPHWTDTSKAGTAPVVVDTVYTRYSGSAGYLYDPVSAPPRLAWREEYIGTSFEDAKAKVVEFAATLGLDNVRLDRIVDLSTVLYPIS